jgi:transposase-like protein
MARNQGKVGLAKSEVVAQLPLACCDETAAFEFMERQRWGDSPRCMMCEGSNVYKMIDAKTGQRNRRFLWRCRDCDRQFTVRIGTVFEESRIPLRHWCYAFWAACASKKGVSAKQIQRQTGLSYKSALFMMHRIRYAMADDYSQSAKLAGTVEVDETYVGGKPRNSGPHNKRGAGTKKTPVVALVQRDGNVRTWPIEMVSIHNLQSAILEHVDRGSRIMTDECFAYKGIDDWFEGGHHTVKHTAKEYARGDVFTNTAESFFSRVKRAMYGTFHSVSKRHLHRYIAYMEFLHNARKVDDGARTVLAIKKSVGKRLRYKEPVAPPAEPKREAS